MRKTIIFGWLMAMMMPLAAMAYYETVDGIRWTYNVRSGEARVESISLVSPLPPSETMDVMIPATLGIYPVTSIGMNVFRYKNWIGSVTIPSSVETIDSGALRGCSGLVSIDVEWDNPVYSSVDGILYNCELTELIQCPGGKSGVVTIPGSVKEILDYAFYNCSGLTSVIIPSDVVKIGRMAFQGCRGLTAVTFPACVARLGDVFPSAYATISEVTICEGVTEIGRYSFQGFRGLITVTIPPSVTNIGDWAFNGCRSLVSIAIPSGVSLIGDRAFSGCSGLMSIEVECDNPVYGSIDGVLYSKAQTELIKCPEGKTGVVTIPSSVTQIGGLAFSSCSRPEIPNS